MAQVSSIAIDTGDVVVAAGRRDAHDAVLAFRRDMLDAATTVDTTTGLLEWIGARVEAMFPDVACRLVAMDAAGKILAWREPASWPRDDAFSGSADDPLLASAASGEAVFLDDLQMATRWREHAALAMLRGRKSCHVAPFGVSGDQTGAIAVYSPRRAGRRARRLRA